MTFDRDDSSFHSSHGAVPTRGAPGKRALTDRIQRTASAEPRTAVEPARPAGSSPWTEPPLSSDISYVDSLLAAPVQRHAAADATDDVRSIHALAAAGTADSGGPLPYLSEIQRSFGAHDVSGAVAHTGAAAGHAATAMGATAFATGNHVAFAGTPDLHTAAHEAAHVVQQRAGVHLRGGVGETGDPYEQHADAVADAVVRGDSAEALLTTVANPASAGAGAAAAAGAGSVQHRSMPMTRDDEVALLDLKLQQTAGLARQAQTAPRGAQAPLVRAATTSLHRALQTDAVDATAVRAFGAADAAFCELAILSEMLPFNADQSVAALAPTVSSAIDVLVARFERAGWKKPAATPEALSTRADRSRAAGNTTLTSAERARLATLHLRSAAQYLSAGWDEIAAGRLDGVTEQAAKALEEAGALLIDPKLDGEATADILVVDDVIRRVFLHLENHPPSRRDRLLALARQQDHLLKLISKPPQWVARLGTLPGAAKAPAKPADPQVLTPPVHDATERATYKHRIRISSVRDRAFSESTVVGVGTIELTTLVVKSSNGVVYVADADAMPEWHTENARQHLSVIKHVNTMPFSDGGRKYIELSYTLTIAGPGVTTSSSKGVEASFEVGGHEGRPKVGIKGSLGSSESTTSQGTAFVRRVYRITDEPGLPIEEIGKHDFKGFDVPKVPGVLESGFTL